MELWRFVCKQQHFRTLVWQSLNVSPVIMLHIILDQWLRLGVVSQGFMFVSASGQLLDTFQVFENANDLPTSKWPWVVKSFWPSPSKFPHRPHTSPYEMNRTLKKFYIWCTMYKQINNMKTFPKVLLLFQAICDIACIPNFPQCYLQCAVAQVWCEQLFCDPTQQPGQWQFQQPDTNQTFLFCKKSKGLFPGPLLHVFLLRV